MTSKVNQKSFLSVMIGVFILLSMNLVGCKKDETSTDSDKTSVGIGCNTTSNTTENLPNISNYPIVSTNQTKFYDNFNEITAPTEGSTFYGQNAMYLGTAPQYVENGDGTVTDMVTGLMWQQSPDNNCDGIINHDDKVSYNAAVNGVGNYRLAGYTDWRLPTIKELYSLIMFNGDFTTPFIDTTYFAFGYGDVDAGERIIEGNFITSTLCVNKTCGDETDAMFGVNFADGRIKAYPITFPGNGNTNIFYFRFVRGNSKYGINNFTDNSNGTISDNATGLMWMQNDNNEAISWENALSYAENFQFAGYSDWRLPNAKELQSIVDYTRSPDYNNSPAINPVFNCTKITNEIQEDDYGFYWTNTTHETGVGVYICFGRGMGYMTEFGGWTDVHGAGCQRSDPKTGNASDFPEGRGPQGDAIRILNYVRLVRNN